MLPRNPRTPFESVVRRRFLVTGWPWRSLGYLLTSAAPMLMAAVPLALLSLPWTFALLRTTVPGDRPPLGTLVFLIALGALLIMGFGPLIALPLAELERLRLRLVDSRPVASGHRRPPAPGPWAWLRTRYTEATTWRELGYACLLVTVIPAMYLAVTLLLLLIGVFIASPLLTRGDTVALGFGQITADDALPYALIGLASLPTLPYLLAVLAGAQGAVARTMLQPGSSEDLRAHLVEVSRSRARLVDAFEAERRRIERDLHDGAQQRLIALTLQLGLARLDLPPDSPANQSVAGAHEQAKQLMVELQELIRGIHPRVLTDLGLPAALGEITDQTPFPIRVSTDLPGRLPSHIEGTAYFVVAEALNNITKHSGATEADVTARWRGDVLTVEISDNGNGGATPDGGTGLIGLADRVAVMNGRMLLSSPVGGPTLLRVELPCSQNDLPSE
ncbi:sensor histidine kinase [Streptosporangium sp. CA-135522]|uniref:sensor histidine kinase n=1 Tax=Streptosporangium sp. CA-135522 TaxID=3240072 RepID=UPI003D93D4EA